MPCTMCLMAHADAVTALPLGCLLARSCLCHVFEPPMRAPPSAAHRNAVRCYNDLFCCICAGATWRQQKGEPMLLEHTHVLPPGVSLLARS